MSLYLIVFDGETACVTTEEPYIFIPRRWPGAVKSDDETGDYFVRDINTIEWLELSEDYYDL
jgi:hypothetical protein